MAAILKKEIRTYLTTIPGYFFAGAFVLVIAIFFGLLNIDSRNPFFTFVLADKLVVFFSLVFIPALTMRLFADEQKQKTDQLLYTSPLTVNQIVWGKYISAIIFFAAALAITLLFPFILGFYGETEPAQVACSYLGYFLLGCSFISVGVLISSLTESQVIAFAASFAVLVIMFFMDSIALSLPLNKNESIIFLALVVALVAYIIYDSTKNILAPVVFALLCVIAGVIVYFVNPFFYDGLIVKIVQWFSILDRFTQFSSGILHVSDIVFYISYSFAFVFLTTKVIEKRRWR